MKFLIELYPPSDVKNEMEKSADIQKKVGEALQRMKPLAAWFTYRYGFIVVEAESVEDLNRKVAPLFHLFRTDIKIGYTDLSKQPNQLRQQQHRQNPECLARMPTHPA